MHCMAVRNGKRWWLLLGLAAQLLAMGCSQAALGEAERVRLRQKSALTAFSYPLYPTGRLHVEITAFTPAKALALGLMLGPGGGGLFEANAGSSTQTRAGLREPGGDVMDAFLTKFSTAFPESTIHVLSQTLPEDEAKRLKKEAGNEWLLEFRTMSWRLHSPPFHHGLRITYLAGAVLLEPVSHKFIWGGKCWVDHDLKPETTMEQLTANGAAMFKKDMTDTARACADELWDKFQNGQK